MNHVIKCIEIFFNSWSISTSWCKTLLCLIPKVENLINSNQLRPIGLSTTHYMILTKILVNRLRPHLTNLISPLQGAFIKGRDAADLFLLAHEVLHSMNKSKSKKGSIILKLDIRKAFDTISWQFIQTLLHAYDLLDQWISLVNSCLSSMEYTPIFNGIKLNPFKPSRGVRQGDPISPYIFILAMEYLSIQIQQAIKLGNLKPFKIGTQGLKVSHLLFKTMSCVFLRQTLSDWKQ